jgi:cytochrome b561
MMSEDIFVEDWRGAKPQPRAGHFDRISIAVHWLTVVLVATQFATAWLLNLAAATLRGFCSFTAQSES